MGWGTAWPVIKAILQDLPPLWTLVFRSAIGTSVLFVISASRQSLIFPKRGDTAVVLNVALLHMVAFAALVSVGLQFVPAGRSIVLGYTTPLWVTVGARLFLGEALTALDSLAPFWVSRSRRPSQRGDAAGSFKPIKPLQQALVGVQW